MGKKKEEQEVGEKEEEVEQEGEGPEQWPPNLIN